MEPSYQKGTKIESEGNQHVSWRIGGFRRKTGNKYETPDLDEVVYAIGQQVRTRRWTWRQSENVKITSASTDIFFPIDGFTDFNRERVLAAQDELQMWIARIWGCKTIVGLVDFENPYMEL